MRQIVVDTNVLLSFLTDRNPGQQEKAADLFHRAAAGEHSLVLPQVALAEMVYVLLNLYGVSAEETAQTLADLLDLPGTSPVNEISWALLLDLWPRQVPEFGDAALTAVARHGHYEAVATFDARLSRALRRLGVPTCW